MGTDEARPDAGILVPHDALVARAREVPEAVALVVDGGESLTFRRWDEQSSAFARGLTVRGLPPGGRLGLLFGNAQLDEYAIAYAGAHKAGQAAVPLSARLPGAELAAIATAARVSAVVCATGQAAPPLAVPVLAFGDVGRGEDTRAVRAPVSPDDLAEVLFTSGTTGGRRGVAVSFANIAGDWLERDPDAAPEPGYFLHATPLGTNAGQVTLRGALSWPPTTLVQPEFSQLRFCELIESCAVATVLMVPAMALGLIAAGDFRRFDLSSVRTVIVTAATLPPAGLARLAAVFPGAVLRNAYSSTEAWPARTSMRYDPARPRSLGRPLDAAQVRVTGPGGRPQPTGATGQIWLRPGPGIPSRRLLDEPELGGTEPIETGPGESRAAALDHDTWVPTGDTGHLDEDGFLYLTGRDSELISTGGFSVAAQDVEAALHDHPAVTEAAVVGLPHRVLGQAIAAAVLTRSPVTPAELRSFAARRLPPHQVPARIAIVEDLPRNAALKVMKDQVAAMLTEQAEAKAGPRPAAGPVPPRGELQATVARLWAQVLGGGPPGSADDFFAAGGDSLAAAELTARIHRETGVRLTARRLFDAPTVAALADLIVEARRASAATAESGGSPPPGQDAAGAPIPRLRRAT
jgi:acyl-CoA synthetase (AMP-forming)/AMP-acid ligase II/acyl carrier protein